MVGEFNELPKTVKISWKRYYYHHHQLRHCFNWTIKFTESIRTFLLMNNLGAFFLVKCIENTYKFRSLWEKSVFEEVDDFFKDVRMWVDVYRLFFWNFCGTLRRLYWITIFETIMVWDGSNLDSNLTTSLIG